MLHLNWKKELLTVPNLLSLFRLVLIPVYVIIYLNATESYHYMIASAILAVSCLTDMIDGKIARKFNMVSTVGKLLDPVADKATQLALILCLAVRHHILWALLTLFLIKEGFQLIALLLFFRKGEMLDGALITGKICTTVLFLSLIVLVLVPQMPQVGVSILVGLCAVATLVSFIDYFRQYFRKKDKIIHIPE